MKAASERLITCISPADLSESVFDGVFGDAMM